MHRKTVYFVRHGESEDNVKQVHQGAAPPESPLSEKGVMQALKAAQHFDGISIDKVISSTYARTVQTADIIAHSLGVEHEQSDLFGEIRNPKELVGLPYRSEESSRIQRIMFDNAPDPTFRYSNEENAYDLKERGLRARRFLENREEKTLVIVSHKGFLRVLSAVLLFGEDVNGNLLRRYVHGFSLFNAAVCKWDYDTVMDTIDRWRMHSWNDTSHLD